MSPSIHQGANQLALRTGISSTIIPNVMDFETPPPPPDDYTSDVRQALGLNTLGAADPAADTCGQTQRDSSMPSNSCNRLGAKAKLVISHASGDEGHDYERRVWEYSRMLDVDTLFVSDIINDQSRETTEDGRKIYTLDDIYPHADLVTYPSNFEGFGNAFLEAIYFRKPILVNNYSIYTTDIRTKGFEVIEIDGYVTKKAVQLAKRVLREEDLLRSDGGAQLPTRHDSIFPTKFCDRSCDDLLGDCLPCRLAQNITFH